MMTSKQLVRGAFESAELPRLPFIPWIFTHAARLEQVPLRRMYADPTQYTKCLQNARKLYGYDGIVGCFDASLETEMCGRPVHWAGDYNAPAVRPDPGFDFTRLKDINMENAVKTGRFGTVIESLRRINKVSGAEVALAAVVSGPLTLMAGLTGKDPLKELTDRPEETFKNIEAAAGFLLKIVQVYCQLELDIIAIADRWIASLPAAPLHRVQPVFSPMVNTARFYNAFSVLLPGEPSPDNVASVLDLGFDGTVAAGIDTARWQETKGGRSCVLGKAVATDVMRSGAREVQEYLNKHIPGKTERGMFLTTEWEVPPETPPDNIHMVMSMVSGKQRP